jgi:hypothetical protein
VTVTRTQVSTLSSVASATTASTNFATNPTAGNKIIVGIFGQSNADPTLVTDDGGNTYALVLSFHPSSDNSIRIYYADNIALPGAGTLDVTVNWASSVPSSIQAISYDGAATGAANGTNNHEVVANGTTGDSNGAGAGSSGLHFAVVGVSTSNNPANIATSASFTQQGAQQNGATFYTGAVSDQLNALASQTSTWTWTTGIARYTAGIAAWDDAAGAPPLTEGPIVFITRSTPQSG